MKKLLTLIAATVFMSLMVTNAMADIYASEVDWVQGTNVTDPARMIPTNALGAPDGNFLSLGLGGVAMFGFGQQFDTTSSVFEITSGNRENYLETANIYVGNIKSTNIADFTLVTSIDNSNAQTIVDLSGVAGSPFTYLLIVDTTVASQGATQGDGFDVAAVSVQPTPIPGAVWLLGSGLFGLVGFRRRMKRN